MQKSTTQHTLYIVKFDGKTRLIQAEDMRALKAHIFDSYGFSADKATPADVLAHCQSGGEVETAGGTAA